MILVIILPDHDRRHMMVSSNFDDDAVYKLGFLDLACLDANSEQIKHLKSLRAQLELTGDLHKQKLWDMYSMLKATESSARCMLYLILFLPMKSISVMKGNKLDVWSILKKEMRDPLNEWVREAREKNATNDLKEIIKDLRDLPGAVFYDNPLHIVEKSSSIAHTNNPPNKDQISKKNR